MAIDDFETTLPIREISRLTGVNSVTLRAWERRYGLIKPQRTHKGHRLYRKEDVDLVKKIQAWLARGLAIGKISELLDPNQFSYELDVENVWQSYVDELLILMAELNLGKLDAWFNELFSVYPADLIADQLIVPALEHLQFGSYGNATKRSILINRVSEYLLMLTQRQRQGTKRERIAIAQLTTQTNLLLNTLLHYGLTTNQFKSEMIGITTTSELVFAVNQLDLQAIVIYNNECSSLGSFQKELQLMAQRINVPIIVAGDVAPALHSDFPAHLHILRSGGLQPVFAMLNDLFPADKNLAEVLHED